MKENTLPLAQLIATESDISRRFDFLLINIGANDVASQSFPQAIRDVLSQGGTVLVLDITPLSDTRANVSPSLHCPQITILNVHCRIMYSPENVKNLIDIWEKAGMPFVMVQNFACSWGGFFEDRGNKVEESSLFYLIDRFFHHVRHQSMLYEGTDQGKTCLVLSTCSGCTCSNHNLLAIYEADKTEPLDRYLRIYFIDETSIPFTSREIESWNPGRCEISRRLCNRYSTKKLLRNNMYTTLTRRAYCHLSTNPKNRHPHSILKTLRVNLKNLCIPLSLADTDRLGLRTREIMPNLLTLLERRSSHFSSIHQFGLFACTRLQVRNRLTVLGFTSDEREQAHRSLPAEDQYFDTLYVSRLLDLLCDTSPPNTDHRPIASDESSVVACNNDNSAVTEHKEDDHSASRLSAS